MRYLDRVHPLALFVYFLAVIVSAMFLRHPFPVVLCCLSGLVLCGVLQGLRALLSSLCYSLPLTLLLALTNPLFVHRGVTILFFLNGNPVTLEAILCGANGALALLGIYTWCKCYSLLMTADKFVDLFGRAAPRLGLILSMTLGFLPLCRRRWREIEETQRGLGIYAAESRLDRLRAKLRVFSILVTRSLEGAVETADSMRAQGYGLPGRTRGSLFRFTVSDALLTAASFLLGGGVLALSFTGAAAFDFYPALAGKDLTPTGWALTGALAVLTLLPLILEGKESLTWRFLRSKI